MWLLCSVEGTTGSITRPLDSGTCNLNLRTGRPRAPACGSRAGPPHHALDGPAVLDVGTGCGEQSTALEPTGSDDEQG